MLLRRPSGRPQWSVTARRLDPRLAPGAARHVVLLVEDLMRQPGEIEPVLGAVFNLTPREATLAAALARGNDLADASALLGITLGTARIYLKSIFAKTRTRRQAELVGLILRLTRFSG
jgi:DNA-binding CsgD family transcriptional regulator